MCSAHIFKLFVMCGTRNMCSAHILRLHICACLRLLYAVPFLRTLVLFLTVGFAGAPLHSGAKFLYYGIYVLFGFAYNFIRRLKKRVEFLRLSIIRLKSYPAWAQNMCSAHIFKVTYMYLHTLISGIFNRRWSARTPNRCTTGVRSRRAIHLTGVW